MEKRKYAVFTGKSIKTDTFDNLLNQEILIYSITHGNPSAFRRDEGSEHEKKISAILDNLKVGDDNYVYCIRVAGGKEHEFEKIAPSFCRQNNLECGTYEM